MLPAGLDKTISSDPWSIWLVSSVVVAILPVVWFGFFLSFKGTVLTEHNQIFYWRLLRNLLARQPRSSSEGLLNYLQGEAIELERAFQRHRDAKNLIHNKEDPTKEETADAGAAEKRADRLKKQFWKNRKTVLEILTQITPRSTTEQPGMVDLVPGEVSECASMDVKAVMEQAFGSASKPIND